MIAIAVGNGIKYTARSSAHFSYQPRELDSLYQSVRAHQGGVVPFVRSGAALR